MTDADLDKIVEMAHKSNGGLITNISVTIGPDGDTNVGIIDENRTETQWEKKTGGVWKEVIFFRGNL